MAVASIDRRIFPLYNGRCTSSVTHPDFSRTGSTPLTWAHEKATPSSNSLSFQTKFSPCATLPRTITSIHLAQIPVPTSAALRLMGARTARAPWGLMNDSLSSLRAARCVADEQHGLRPGGHYTWCSNNRLTWAQDDPTTCPTAQTLRGTIPNICFIRQCTTKGEGVLIPH